MRSALEMGLRALLAACVGGFASEALVPLLAPSEDPLVVTALGEKGPHAQSDEVWVRLYDESGRDASSSLTPTTDGWSRKNGWWLSGGGSPKALTAPVARGARIALRFVSHPWSGKVRVELAGRAETIDLYAPSNGALEHRLTAPAPSAARRWPVALGAAALAWFALGRAAGGAARAAPTRRRAWLALGLGSAGLGLFLAAVWPLRGVWDDVLEARDLWEVLGTGALGAAAVALAAAWGGLRRKMAAGRTPAGPAVLVWVSGLAWLAAFFPGMMSVDSVSAWAEIQAGAGFTDFPAAHTLYLGILSLGRWPAGAAFFQVTALAALFHWCCRLLFRSGVHPLALWAGAGLLALSPVAMGTAVTHWRDVPYGLAVLLLTALMLRLWQTGGEALRGWRFVAALTGGLAATALFRYNGFFAAAGVVLGLAVVFRRRSGRVLIAGVGAGLAVALVKGVLYPALHVVPSGIASAGIAHHIAAHLKRGTPLRTAEQALLEEVRPIRDDAWDYDCSSVNATVFSRQYNRALAEARLGELAALELALALRAPATELGHMVCAANLVWSVHRTPAYGKYVFAVEPSDSGFRYIVRNPYVEEASALWPGALQALQRWLYELESPLLVRPAFYLYALLFAFAVSALRLRSGAQAILLLPAVATSLSVGFFAVAQDVRYQYPVFLAALILVPAMLSMGRGPTEPAAAPGASGEGATPAGHPP